MVWYAPIASSVGLQRNTFAANGATTFGGGLASVSDCGASVVAAGDTHVANYAGWAGGAMAVVQLASSSSGLGFCRNGSAPVWEGATATNNTAGYFGGSLFVAPGAAANVRGLVASGEMAGSSGSGSAGSGGSIAALNCTFLTVTDSSIRGSTAVRSGGGVLASGCGWVVLERTEVVKCAAGAAGGGVHLAAPGLVAAATMPVAVSVSASSGSSSSSSNASEAGDTSAYGRVVLSGVTLAGNRAGGSSSGTGTGNGSGSGSSSSSGGYIPRGGGLFVEGQLLAVAVSASDLSSLSNSAALGSALASTQRCNVSVAAAALAASFLAGAINTSNAPVSGSR